MPFSIRHHREFVLDRDLLPIREDNMGGQTMDSNGNRLPWQLQFAGLRAQQALSVPNPRGADRCAVQRVGHTLKDLRFICLTER